MALFWRGESGSLAAPIFQEGDLLLAGAHAEPGVTITLILTDQAGARKRYVSRDVVRMKTLVMAGRSEDRVFLRVDYLNGFDNSGTYLSRREALQALQAFTEKLLVRKFALA